MTIRRSLAAIVLFAATAHPLQAEDCLPVVESGWIRQPPMAMPMMAGFGVVRNACDAPATIVSASSPAFGSVELHETRRSEGVSRMRHVESLEVPAHGQATLAPGGLHLMLMQPGGDVAAGQRIAIDLVLADGRALRGEFEVRPPDAR